MKTINAIIIVGTILIFFLICHSIFISKNAHSTLPFYMLGIVILMGANISIKAKNLTQKKKRNINKHRENI